MLSRRSFMAALAGLPVLGHIMQRAPLPTDTPVVTLGGCGLGSVTDGGEWEYNPNGLTNGATFTVYAPVAAEWSYTAATGTPTFVGYNVRFGG